MRLQKELMIRGTIEAEGDLVIEGRVEGALVASQTIVIEPSATIDAEVSAPRVQISGRVRGTVRASESVRVDAAAEMIGDLVTSEISVADGAVLRGRIQMPVDLPEELR